MKKIFAIGLALMVSTAIVAFADEGEMEEPANVAPAIIQSSTASAPVSQPAEAPQRGKIVSETTLSTADPEYMLGIVKCVMPSSLMQPKARLVVSDQGGNDVEFRIKTLAVIYDANGALMSFDSISQGSRVQVNYRTKGGDIKEATSIKVLR
jgi:hypothetical protein